MFLTRMQINTARRGARRLMSSPQAMHAAVLHGFPGPPATRDGRVLWRLDTYEQHRVLLYVASPEKPDFTHIVEQAGWPETATWEAVAYDPLLDALLEGQRWHFRLTANPVHSVRLPGWKDTKPLGHVTVRQQEKWLLDRASRLGFTVVPSPVSGGGVGADGAGAAGDGRGVSECADLAVIDRSVKRFDRNGGRVTIAVATFQGQLEVNDASVMRRTLTHGVGRAKAYGCGLLTLAQPPALPR